MEQCTFTPFISRSGSVKQIIVKNMFGSPSNKSDQPSKKIKDKILENKNDEEFLFTNYEV